MLQPKSFIFSLTFLILLLLPISSQDSPHFDIRIFGIEPNSGPSTGQTRVLVRMTNFDDFQMQKYPHPKCRFGSMDKIVESIYVKCAPNPRQVGEREPTPEERTEICIQCGNNKPHDPDIIPFTVSLIGDFTDILNSVPFRFYVNPEIIWIYPRYGPKDGGTTVDVYGKNFLNYDQNLRCSFGSREVKATYVNETYLICVSPKSDVVQKKLPFSVSLNSQQNSLQKIIYVYYDSPHVSRLDPNKGPDTGGTTVGIRGQNFNPFIELKDISNHNDTFCRFGQLKTSVAKVISSTEMECVSPPSYILKYVPVEVTLNGREYTNDNILFNYYHPPFAYEISPKMGPIKGGTNVSVIGTNYQDTGNIWCKFGDKVTKGIYVSSTQLNCTAPPVDKPQTVNLQVATKEGEYSSGLTTKYRYYDNPVIDRIEPICGPERGYTQITIIGKNFPFGYSEEVKCIFNGNIFTDATVMDEYGIKCDSPSVLNDDGKNEKNITEYKVEITINGVDISGPAQMFYYYVAPDINGVQPIFGPIEGGTTVNITGRDFKQKNACNVTVRFATYQIKPTEIEHSYMIVKSPEANHTGAVVVQVALNGKQFEKDIKVNFRDYPNTFYYYICPKIIEIKPTRGNINGMNNIDVYGVGFIEPYYALDSDINFLEKERIIYYRFTDNSTNNTYGEIEKTTLSETQHIIIKTPKVNNNNTIAKIELSYNRENWCLYNNTYLFLKIPNIVKVDPQFGPVKSSGSQQIDIKLDNYYCSGDCDKILCRYKSNDLIYIQKGIYTAPNTIKCDVPSISNPDSYNLEVSFNNGEDYTNNGFNYTFYDPYVIKVEPQMVSSKGNTSITITGYGFADTGDNLKVLYGSESDDMGTKLKCDSNDCKIRAEYVNSKTIKAKTFPRKNVKIDSTGEQMGYERFPVEVSVFKNDFTNNKVTIFYYDEPDIINNIYDSSIGDTIFTSEEKEQLNPLLVRSLPANVDTYIPIPVDSSKIFKYFKQIEPFAYYTCKYELDNKIKETIGIFISYPNDSNKKNLFLCQSPEWDNVGNSSVRISLNGYDYSDTAFILQFTDPIYIKKVQPPCGPLMGNTQVQLFGTGFQKEKEYIFKWGPQNLIPMKNCSFFDEVKEDEINPPIESEFQISKMVVLSPEAPDYLKTYGGLDYISMTKINFLPLSEFLNDYYTNTFLHTNFEYYYYHQIYIESFYPKGSMVSGGNEIMVIGAWFQNKPEYEVRPWCKFGKEIVKGEYLSTVRITCKSPKYEKPTKVQFGVSLNKVDFIYANDSFVYYPDLGNVIFKKIEPESGPESGGSPVVIYVKNLYSFENNLEFKCQFSPYNSNILMEPKSVPAVFKDFPEEKAKGIECITPGGWGSGMISRVNITVDGQTYIDTGQKFYFFKVDSIEPKSGPNTGLGEITILGGGFKNESDTYMTMDHVKYSSLQNSNSKIVFTIPKMKEDFTGYVDFGYSPNGKDEVTEKDGFYYYIQPNVTSLYPRTGPSKGDVTILVNGGGFRNDFRGVNIGCKAGNYYGIGQYISENEISCRFSRLPIFNEEISLPNIEIPKGTKQQNKPEEQKKIPSPNFAVALNNVSFTIPNANLLLVGYLINSIEPSSGPVTGGTLILVKGAGFFNEKIIRCRFGVPGYYAYTEAEYINYHEIACKSPINFEIPQGGQLPFSVPFSIGFNKDEYNPWTISSHFFSFYNNPEITQIGPKEGKTSETTLVVIGAVNEGNQFTMPSATITEEVYEVGGKTKEKTSFKYQPILCRFGKFGTTEAEYINRTHIKCLTPMIEDDSEIGIEDVNVEVALNGQDFVGGDDNCFTFKGPNWTKMIWVYILIFLFIILLIIALITLILANLSMLNASEGERSQVRRGKLIYLNENLQNNDDK